ncbi:hypothetical protein [Natronoglomus mannanivorans]|uniref:Uncharacterized protein n=1 Tax=Natronoglomus mannanivorans TaxID=2979990 RepID=A0AAP3E230_9EURY|nr:hypothetical protein [Halobacteria archaeon AArc-xg1-1]
MDSVSPIDTSLAIRQSVVHVLAFSAAFAILFSLLGESVVSGVATGLLMAVVLLAFYGWSGILGNPEHAGRFSGRN